MPQRFLKPGITSSPKWDSCSWVAQSFYIRLITLVDDFGRFEANASLLRSMAFPLREDIRTPQVQKLMQELQANQLVDFYTNSDGKDYLQVLNWTERPRADHSKFPPFDDNCKPLFGAAGTLTTNVVNMTASDVSPPTNVDSPRPRLRSSFLDQTFIHPRAKARGTLTQLKKFAAELGLPESDGEACFHKWEGNGWKNNGKAIVSWEATMRSWQAHGFMPSQKINGNGKHYKPRDPAKSNNDMTCICCKKSFVTAALGGYQRPCKCDPMSWCEEHMRCRVCCGCPADIPTTGVTKGDAKASGSNESGRIRPV